MKRRFGIAQALLNNPKVLIIDEPTVGLDPEERLRFYNLLSELAVNRIILLSTHIAADIEATCSNVAVLCAGKVVFEGDTEALLKIGNGKIYTVSFPQDELEDFKNHYNIISIHQNGKDISCRFFLMKNKTNHGVYAKQRLRTVTCICFQNIERGGKINAVY